MERFNLAQLSLTLYAIELEPVRAMTLLPDFITLIVNAYHRWLGLLER